LIHFPPLIFKNAQVRDFFSQVLGLFITVIRTNPQQDYKSRSDLSDCVLTNSDPTMLNAL
jgi:hypothetical protein